MTIDSVGDVDGEQFTKYLCFSRYIDISIVGFVWNLKLKCVRG